MFSKRGIRDRYDSWKKLFLQNWTLFKASRIGLVGLAIMIAFLIVAAAVPYLGLRDPLYWIAPESDTIAVTQWWRQEVIPSNVLFGVNGSVDHAVAFRTLVYQSGEHRVDRIYVAENTRIFALETDFATLKWNCPGGGFQANDTISVDPVVLNYGDFRSTAQTHTYDFHLMFGDRSGNVYAMQDNDDTGCPVPLRVTLGSPITGLAALTVDDLSGLTDRDAFVVGTADGHLYAFTVNRTSGPFYEELWNTTLSPGSPVHLAGSVVRTNEGVPTSSPAFFYSAVTSSRLGETVFAGTGDGWVWSVWMSNGTVRWSKLLGTGAPWSSAPIVQPASEITPVKPTLVYATTKDAPLPVGTNATKVYVLDAETGRPLASWQQVVPAGDGGLPIVYRGAIDTGVPNTPAVFGSSIYVTTSTGWLYSVNRDPVRGTGGVIVQDAGTVAWAFRDVTFRQDAKHTTYFRAQPYFFNNLQLLVAPGSYNNGTAGESDDLGIVYVFNGATGSLVWKRTFQFAILGMAPAWPDKQHDLPSVFFGTVRGDIYSYSISGRVIAPLPPSWVRSRPCPAGERCEYYILGTDARGRDIFSQLLWGSRIALLVGFASAFFTISIGVIIGLVAGYLGGRVENILMRFTDVILVIPGLPLVIILAAVLGAGVGNIILVISIVGWPGVARVIRAEVLSLKERPFIDSAKVTGASNVRIMFRHIAPNVAPLAFLYMTFAVSGAILTEAALSFIGLGDVNTISWGLMLQDVSQSKALQAWWWLLPPGLAITLISLAFFLVGRAFDEIVNPRLRKR
ncbi:MAG: ABC transporter permease subunit [Methanobacteriota archaeon]|nr:MAG: ABC transporter permease subunit [Euryarchaeota archaeon]